MELVDAKKEARPYTKDGFIPYGAEQASVIARQVAQEWAANPRHSRTHNPCKACTADNRVEVDRLLLMAVPFPRVRQVLGSNYNYPQLKRHRDFHLLPHVAGLQPTAEQMLLLAWPADEDRRTKVRFYAALAFGLFHESLRAGDRRTALSALRSMAEFDLGQSGTLSKALSYSRCGTDAPAAPIAMPAIVTPSPEDAAILDRAIRLSASRRPSWEPPEDTDTAKEHSVVEAKRY